MAIDQNAWTDKTVNGFMVAKCTFASDATIKDTYTFKIPAGLIDGTKPWVMFLSAAGTLDAQAVPLDIWVGYDDNFALASAEPITATSGGFYKRLVDDCVLAVTTNEHVYYMHPDLGVADVVTVAAIAAGYKINCPAAPYYAFAIDGGTSISADAISVRVVQKR